MSETLPPTSSTGETIAYQPISGWAVAGLGASAIFTLMVVSSAVVGLFQGAPVFFPIWLLGIAAIGAILSYIGQRHIETSENTRSGHKVATIGLWLGIISGLAYLSYFYVTGWALETQANSFLMEEGDDAGFFPRVKKGGVQLNAAFLLTLPAQARSGRSDDESSMNELHNVGKDGGPGRLAQFRDSHIPRLLHGHLAEDAKIIPGAVQGWRYEKRSYSVARIYRIETIELEADLHITVQSSEGESEGQGRKWFVNMQETAMISHKLTPLGVGVFHLRARAREHLQGWIEKLNNGAAFNDFNDKDTAWDVIPVGPGLDRRKLSGTLRESFGRSDKARFQQVQIIYRADRPDFDLGKWESNKGKIRFFYAWQFTLPAGPSVPQPIKVDAVAVLETKHEVDVERFTDTTPAPEWNLVRLGFTQASIAASGMPK